MSDANTIGREPVTIVEIDQDSCPLTYGVAPCEAALGVTGDAKCFNTRASCQDPDNYQRDFLTLRFCTPAGNLPRDIILFPSIVSITSMPTEINLGGDQSSSPLGTRASVTITIIDHPYHDRVVDRYWSERDYDAMERGTFWTKWLARNPFYQGRALRVRDGYIGQSLGDMVVRHYIIERIEGPTSGSIQIVAKDPIKLLEFARSQAPRPGRGTLSAILGAGDTALTLLPAGVGSEYSAAGNARIGSELVSYIRSNDQITLTGRGLRTTDASEHKIGDTFQEVLVFSRERVDLVLRSLLVDFAGMNSDFIIDAEWAVEGSLWSSALTVSAWITKPEGVAKLVGEILQQTLCFIWWDVLAQRVRFKALRPRLAPIDPEPTDVNDVGHIVAGSVSVKDKPDERISQVWIYYDQIDPTGSDNDPSNFARLRVRFDGEAESEFEYNERRIDEIFARWLGEGNDASALALSVRKLQRYRDTPKVFNFSLDAKDASIKPSDLVQFSHYEQVGIDGLPRSRVLQITSADPVEPGHRTDLSGRPHDFFADRYAFVVATGSPVYSLASEPQKFFGAWIAPDENGFANGDPPYRII